MDIKFIKTPQPIGNFVNVRFTENNIAYIRITRFSKNASKYAGPPKKKRDRKHSHTLTLSRSHNLTHSHTFTPVCRR